MNGYQEGTLPDGWYEMISPLGGEVQVVQVRTKPDGGKTLSTMKETSWLAPFLEDGYEFNALVSIREDLHEGLAMALVALSTYVSRVGFLGPDDQEAASKGLLALAVMLNVPEVIRAQEKLEEERLTTVLAVPITGLSESQRFWSRRKLRETVAVLARDNAQQGHSHDTAGILAWRDAAYIMGDAYELELRKTKAQASAAVPEELARLHRAIDMIPGFRVDLESALASLEAAEAFQEEQINGD